MKFTNLLVNLGLAVGNAAAKWDPTGIASKLLEGYEKRREKLQLRAELEAMLQAGFDQFRDELADAMSDPRLKLPEGIRVQIEAYLSQFQASAKQAARHFGDPSATTVPATVSIDSAAELAAFLPQRPPRFTIGESVPGLPSWKLIEPLGAGGFGEVWKAENPDDDVPVAAFKFFIDSAARSRFTRVEAAALREIHRKAPHDGVVKLRQAEPLAEPPWLQFEYVSGGDLSRLSKAWEKLSNVERVKRIQVVIRTLATTAGHFHELGVVHRDLKPSNILLRKTAAGHKLVIADFGISKIVLAGGNASTPSGASLVTIRAYTPVYASPQQKRGLPADKRDDVYSLGVLWYQLLRGDLTLERPGGEGWKDELLELGVPSNDIALLNRCWDDKAEKRPSDGNELAKCLKSPKEIHQQISEEDKEFEANPRGYMLRRGTFALGALMLLTIISFFIFWAIKRPEDKQMNASNSEKPLGKDAGQDNLKKTWLLPNGNLDPSFLIGRWIASPDQNATKGYLQSFPQSLTFSEKGTVECEIMVPVTVDKLGKKDGIEFMYKEQTFQSSILRSVYIIDLEIALLDTKIDPKYGSIKIIVIDKNHIKGLISGLSDETLTLRYSRGMEKDVGIPMPKPKG
jgi:serine/threonine protein kinase